MKSKLQQGAFFLASLLLIFNLFSSVSYADAPAEHTGKKMDIVFLHDTHSHLNNFLTIQNGKSSNVGGFAQIKTLINKAKDNNPDTLVVDAGDFSMGTLVQTIFSSQSAELRMLGELGCEVTTLGNHEFDYRSSGLADSLNAAVASGDSLPAMVLCNIDWDTMEAEGLTEEQKLLKDAFEAYGMTDYKIITKGDVKIAVIGVFGIDSLSCAPTCVLKFKDASEAVAQTISTIKEKEQVDMILCVSHCGTSDIESRSEDEILAKNVPEIDVIVSGHSHTILDQPIKHGDTYIVSEGEYGKNFGTISLNQRTDGRWDMNSYELYPVTQGIEADAQTQAKIDYFMEIVDSSYLAPFGYTRTQILAENDVVFATSPDCYADHKEQNLGSFLSDSFRYAVSKADTGDSNPVSVTVVPSGCIRDTFPTGMVSVEDVFNTYSLGIGLDGVSGYPLISLYLTGEELKTCAEIDASVSDFMNSARLFTSGLNFTFNPHRLILSKVTDCYLSDDNGERVELENKKLYRVVCDLYSGQMLGAVTDVSFGILSIKPKFADGTVIENIEDAIIHTNGKEIKAWDAIAQYMGSFEDTDGNGIANVPSYYSESLGRKVIEDSTELKDLLKNPSKYAIMIVAVVLVLLILIILLIVLITKLIRKLCRKHVDTDENEKK